MTWRFHFPLRNYDFKVTATAGLNIEVTKAVQALGVNKAAELGGIFAEHLMYCNDRLYTMLAMCLTGFFVHGFLPDSILAVVRVPIIKDRTGRIDLRLNLLLFWMYLPKIVIYHFSVLYDVNRL